MQESKLQKRVFKHTKKKTIIASFDHLINKANYLAILQGSLYKFN